MTDAGAYDTRRPRRLRPNVLARIVRSAIQHPLIVVALWSIFAGLGGAGTTLLRLDPASEKPVVIDAAWRGLQSDFAAVTDPLIAVVESSDPKLARRAAERLTEELERRSDLYRDVFMPGAGRFFEESGLLYLDRADIERIAARIEGAAPLFRGLAAAPNLAGLAVLAEQAGRVAAAGGSPGGLTALFREAERTARAQLQNRRHDLDWLSLAGDRIDLDSTRWYVFAYLQNPDDGAETAAAMAEAARQSDTLGAENAGNLVTTLTGRPMLQRMPGLPAMRAIAMPGLMALVLICVMLTFGLAGPAQIFAISIAFAAAGLTAAGLLAAIEPLLDRSCLAAPAVMLGLAAPAFIALTLRAEQAERHGVSALSAWMLSAHQLGPALVIWFSSVAAAGGAIYAAEWAGIGMAGLVTGLTAAVVACAAMTLLPALMRLLAGPWIDEEPHWLDDLLARPDSAFFSRLRLAGPVLLIAIALPGAMLIADMRLSVEPERWEISQGPAAERFAEAAEREPALKAQAHVLARPGAEARALSRALSVLPEVAAVRTIESFLPPEEAEKRAILARLTGLLPRVPDGTASPPDAALRGEFLRLQEGLRIIAGQTATDADLRRAADGFRESLAALDAAGAASDMTLRRLETGLFANLPLLLGRIDDLSRREPFTIAKLDPVVVRQFVSQSGLWRLEIVPRDPRNLDRFLASVRRVAPNAAGAGFIARERDKLANSGTIPIAAVWLAAALFAPVIAFRHIRPIINVAGSWLLLAFAAVTLLGLTRTVLKPEAAGVVFAFLAVGLGSAMLREAWMPPGVVPTQNAAPRAFLLSHAIILAGFAPFALSAWLPLRQSGQVAALTAALLLFAAMVVHPQLRMWTRPRPKRDSYDLRR